MKNFLTFLVFFTGIIFVSWAQSTVKHTVVKGDTAYNISKRYGTTPEAIFKLNPGTSSGIKLGAILEIPVKNGTVGTLPPKVNDSAKGASTSKLLEPLPDSKVVQEITYKIHKVKSKETMFSIAKKYELSVDAIKKHNKRLYSESLRKGDKIKIPQLAKGSPEALGIRSTLSTTTKYSIRPKDTKFGIARRHGITIAELQTLNPSLGEILDIGTEITVPTSILVPYEEESDPRFELYEIQPKETIYNLTKRLGISNDSLNALNPYLRDEGLKSGMILRIPKIEGFSANGVVDFEEGPKINLERQLNNYSTKKLALLLPFNLKSVPTESEAMEAQLRKDRVLRIALDFYTGVLLAVEKAKSKGISTEINILDTENSKKKILDLIDEKGLREMDAVIGPMYQKNIEVAANELKAANVPVFSPISNKDSKLGANFFQSKPSDGLLQDKLIHFVKKDTSPKNIVIIADAKHQAIKKKLMDSFPTAKILDPEKENFIKNQKVLDVLDAKLRNWVFVESKDIPLISNVVPFLNSKADSLQVRLFTTDKNSAFDNEAIQNSHLAKLELHYPSIYRNNDAQSKSFISSYRRKHGQSPSVYAIRGFDLTYDILLRLASSGSLFESVSHQGTTEYVENKFNYARKSEGGYYNKASYIMQYTKDMVIKKVE